MPLGRRTNESIQWTHRMWSGDLRNKRGCTNNSLHCIADYWTSLVIIIFASPITEHCVKLATNHWMTIMHYYSANVLEVGFSCPRPTYHYLWKENSIRTSDQVRQPSSNHSAHFSFANILLRQKLCKVCLPLSNISLSFDFPYTVTMFRIMYGSCFFQRNWIDEDVLWAMLFLIVCIFYSFWSFFLSKNFEFHVISGTLVGRPNFGRPRSIAGHTRPQFPHWEI